MSTGRTARKTKPRPRQARASSFPDSRSASSPAFMGLVAIAMAVPLAVVGSAAGPYDDAKGWILPILTSATALGRVATRGTRLGRPSSGEDRATHFLWWTVLAYLAWWGVAAATSIAPGLSLLGNFGRGMGFLTFGSATALFFIARSECRTPETARRLVDAALLGSAPVCAFAFGQALGWDPFPPAWDPATAQLSVRSTLGQHIFLGSYLAILIPLGVGRLWEERRARVDSSLTRVGLWVGAAWVVGAIAIAVAASRWPIPWLALVGWALVGAVAWTLSSAVGPPRRTAASAALSGMVGAQIAVLVLCGARGPLLGLLFASIVIGVVLFGRGQARKGLVGAAVGLALLTAVAFVLLVGSRSSLPALARLPMLQRWTELGSASPGSSTWFRIGVWRGILAGWNRQMAGEQIIAGTSPAIRNAVGYGLETQLIAMEPLVLPTLGTLLAPGQGWQAQYLIDRAHNVVLDHLVTGGLVAAALWLALAGSIVAVGWSRAKHTESAIPAAALAALVAHLAEQQVGIATAAPLALFWISVGLLASGAWSSDAGPPVATRARGPGWIVSLVAAALAVIFVSWIGTRWMLGSIAYADGTRNELARATGVAYQDFQRSTALVPWLPLPAVATAYTALRLAGAEPDPVRRSRLLHEGEMALDAARKRAAPDAASWALAAQLAFAEARAGDRSKLPVSLAAFESATRLRPQDAQLLAQAGWARLESGDAVRAREAAQRAIALSPNEWLSWVVLARAARALGDAPEAQRAVDNARRLAPQDAQRMLDSML